MGLLLALPQAAAADDAAPSPLALAATAIGDAIAGISGGLKRGGRLLGKADLSASFAGDGLGFSGLTAFLDVQAGAGGDFSGRIIGDAQTVSNVDGSAGLRLANAWLAREFDGLGGVKVGALTSGEFRMLETLVTRANRVLTRDQIMDACHGGNSPAFDRSIDVCIGRLRKKLNDDPRNPAFIRTVRNGGYIFAAKVTRPRHH